MHIRGSFPLTEIPMHWLLHGPLTSAVGDALKRHEQKVHALSELELNDGATPVDVLRKAEQKQWEVITADPALASTPFEHHFPFNRVLVFVHLEGGDVEQDDAIDRLFDRYKRLTPRRLYTLTGSRVKIRQLPGA